MVPPESARLAAASQVGRQRAQRAGSEPGVPDGWAHPSRAPGPASAAAGPSHPQTTSPLHAARARGQHDEHVGKGGLCGAGQHPPTPTPKRPHAQQPAPPRLIGPQCPVTLWNTLVQRLPSQAPAPHRWPPTRPRDGRARLERHDVAHGGRRLAKLGDQGGNLDDRVLFGLGEVALGGGTQGRGQSWRRSAAAQQRRCSSAPHQSWRCQPHYQRSCLFPRTPAPAHTLRPWHSMSTDRMRKGAILAHSPSAGWLTSLL